METLAELAAYLDSIPEARPYNGHVVQPATDLGPDPFAEFDEANSRFTA